MKKVKSVQARPRLGELLKKHGLTQEKLANATGIPQGSISRFDKIERHTDEHIFAIMAVLECSYEDLFESLVEFEEE